MKRGWVIWVYFAFLAVFFRGEWAVGNLPGDPGLGSQAPSVRDLNGSIAPIGDQAAISAEISRMGLLGASSVGNTPAPTQSPEAAGQQVSQAPHSLGGATSGVTNFPQDPKKLLNSGQSQTIKEATKTLNEAQASSRRAELTKKFGEDFGQRYNWIQKEVQPKINSPDVDSQQQARSILAAPIDAPPKMAEIYKNLGIQTNADIADKGSKLFGGIQKAEKQFQEDSQKKQESANQALAAAAKMEDFRKKVAVDQTNLKSISPGLGAEMRGEEDSTVTSFSKTGKQTDLDKKTEKASQENLAAASKKSGQSLTEALRQKLKLAEEEKIRNEKETKNTVIETKKEPGKSKEGRELSSIVMDGIQAKEAPSFTMGSLVENEKGIEKLKAELSSETGDLSGHIQSSPEFGSTELSIFMRVKPPLRNYAESILK